MVAATHSYLPPRLRGGYDSARWAAVPVGTPKAGVEDAGGGGILGSGIGPDLNIGIGRTFRELGQGITGLASLVTPARDGVGFADLGKGIISSLAGTGETIAKPFMDLASLAGDVTGLYDVDFEDKFERGIGRLLGDEERFKARDFWENAGDRGILPALVESVGNLSLAGSAVTAPIKGASTAARILGASEKAASLAALREGLLANPALRIARNPYISAGSRFRTRFMAPAAEAVEASQGLRPIGTVLDDAVAPEVMSPEPVGEFDVATAPEDLNLGTEIAEPGLLTATAPDVTLPAAPGAATRFLAKGEKFLQANVDGSKVIREQTRLADMERKIAARSPAVRTSVAVARDYIIDAGRAQGLNIPRREASLIVGDEIRARMTGVKALEDEYRLRGVPDEAMIQAGVRERFIPAALADDPDLLAALDGAVTANIAERANVRQTLLESRPGDKGLTGPGAEDAMDPTLTPKQEKALRLAQRKLDRAASAVLGRKEGRERLSWTKQADAAKDKLGRIAAESQRLDDEAAGAVAEFEHSREFTPKTWRTPETLQASVQKVYDETMRQVAENVAKGDGEWGGASLDPQTGRFVRGGEGTGYAVGLVPGTAREIPLDQFTPGDIDSVVRAYQDVYQHPGTIVGTWVDNGKVYIDPSEVVPTLDDALIRAAARGQESIFDIAGNKVVMGVLKDRPDIAEPFITRRTNLSRRMAEFRQVARATGLPEGDVALTMDTLMRRAVAARDLGLVKHPDDFFRKYVSRFDAAKKGSPVVRQTVKAWSDVPEKDFAKRWAAAKADPGDFAAPAEDLRSVADELSEATGRFVSPEDVQAGVTMLGRLDDAGDPLQAFRDKFLGEIAPLDDVTRSVIRVFEGDDFTNLVRQDGRALRRMLTPEQMRSVEQAYGIEGGKWSPKQKTRFADDYVNYMRTAKAPKGMEGTFGRVRDVLRETWDMVRGTFQRRRVPQELRDVFDEWLDPEVRDVTDPYPGLDVTGTPTSFDGIGATWRNVARTAEAKAAFDAIPDDAPVIVYHGTTKARAAELRRGKAVNVPEIERSGAPGTGFEHTLAKDALYVAPTVADAERYGEVAVPLVVRKRDITPSPEALRTNPQTSVTTALFNSFDGAVLAPGTAYTAQPTMAQRAARPPRLPEPPAKTGDFYQAGRKGQKALAHLEKVAVRQKALAAAKAKTEKTLAAIETVLAEGRLPSELERNDLIAGAARIQETVNEQLGRPAVSRVPARWQPLYQAAKSIAAEAETNPALAGALDGLPETLYEIQQLALSKGFDPVHVREFTPTQVRRLVFGNMRLGLGRDSLLRQVEAGTRKSRTGALTRAGAVDRSVEAFLAASVEATIEKRTNNVVDWVEQTAARKISKGTPIPEGWQPWDPTRTYLLTGTELSADGMRNIKTAANDVMVVPDGIIKTINRYTKDYDHWALRAIRKVTSPWRTLVLTLSPGWYSRNIVGNMILATAEGASLGDWKAAWRSYKNKDEIGRFADVPFVTSDTLAQEAAVMADDSLIPRRGVREAQTEGGKIRGTAQYASRKMLRVNEVVDEFARAAVYQRGLRLNMTPEQAWSRAKEALVDYNALSPFEREAVRAVVPFYAWQKGILKITMKQAIDHPARAGVAVLLGQMQDEYIADRFGMEPQDVPAYYKNLLGSVNVRSFNPFSDPAEIVTVEGVTRSMNPFIELAIRKGLGAPAFNTGKQRLSFFGTPQQDVDVPSELGDMLTRSPGGRILSQGPGENLLGISRVEDDVLRSRFLKARRQIRGIPNPETGAGGGQSYLPPRLRSAA